MPSPPSLDPAKIRSVVRRLDREHHLMLIDRAIELLAPEQLPELVGEFWSLEELHAEGATPSLVEEVHAFCSAGLRGEFYEDFMVDSRNFMSHSGGTAGFIAECQRLLRLLCRASDAGRLHDARQGFELLFELFREIDKFERDIVFFADEAGAWQVGVHWREVLPAWCRCVAAEESPDKFAAVVISAIDEFAAVDRDRLLGEAVNIASAEQRDALDRLQRSTAQG